MELPKPRSLLGWGILAVGIAVTKEKYTDLTWGDVARAPIQGVLEAYNDPGTSGWRKAWNVGIEALKIAAAVGVIAVATAAAPAALAATTAGAIAIAAGSLVVGGLASHAVIDPLLDNLKVVSVKKPDEQTADTQASVARDQTATPYHYASMIARDQQGEATADPRPVPSVQHAATIVQPERKPLPSLRT
jgi:hypothetical protein